MRTETEQRFCGREFTAKEVSLIREVVDTCSGLSRFELANTLFVTMSNDEAAATEAWKILQAESLPNVYILEGGINGWLDTYAHDEFDAQDHVVDHAPDKLAYRFQAATGQLESTARMKAVRRGRIT